MTLASPGLLYVLLLSISSLLIGWTFVVGLNLAELYQPGYEQYSFWQKFSASNSRAFNSEQIQILLSFSAIAFIVQSLTTAFGFFKKSDGHKVAKVQPIKREEIDNNKTYKTQMILLFLLARSWCSLKSMFV
jgi:hypothetical protein